MTVICVCCDVYCVTELCSCVADKNADALKNVLFCCRLLFSDVLDVVAATYNPFQKCLQPCYECGGPNLSNKHNFLKTAFVLILPCCHHVILVTLYTLLWICFRPKALCFSSIDMVTTTVNSHTTVCAPTVSYSWHFTTAVFCENISLTRKTPNCESRFVQHRGHRTSTHTHTHTHTHHSLLHISCRIYSIAFRMCFVVTLRNRSSSGPWRRGQSMVGAQSCVFGWDTV